MNDLVGKQLEKYRIDALLGEGGMGTVYRARHMTLQSTAAIKVMHGHLVRQQTFKQRFLQEAQAAARLDHPGVVKVFDFGRSGEMLYMAMEFVSGGSLGHYIRKLHEQGKVVQLQEVLYILAQVADALGYAHRQGVVHRDVKPDNILLKRLEGPERPGEPPLRAVMTDFGLAKLLEGGVQTATNTFMGTLPYMSPEQTLGEELDGRSDIYSVGVILYQLATGKLPFDISTPTDAVRKHMHETPPPPRTVRPELPAKVAAIIEKALAKKPAERFQSGEVMARSLRAAAGDLTADDVTRFAPVHTVMSLMTELQAEPEKAPERPTMMVPEEAGEGAELVVARKGMKPVRYPLDRPQLTIGRNPDNDVVLAEEGISRHHARLEQTADGWQIVDLGSTNGTYLGDSKLLPDLPEPWQPDQTVRIGPCFLSLRGEATPAQTHFATRLSAGATRVRSSRGGLSVAVEPTQFSAKPGGQAAMQVELFNEGMQVAHYRLEVEGLDPSWVSLPRETAQLMPGDGTTLPVTIRVPRHSSARSGAHPFRLRVISSGEQVAAVPGELTVEPFSEFSIEAQPTHVAHGKSTRLLIHNGGNTETTFAISAQDAADEARFQMAQPRVEVGPGQTETVPVGVQAAKRPFLGRKKTMPFEIAVTAPDGSAKKLPGQLEVQPVVPPWLPPILGTLLILLCLAGAGVFALINSRNAQATETAQALADSAQAATETRIAEETAAARETARAGDAQAGTATALAATAAAAGDDDGDGLSNSQEASLGTSLQNPDTDGDGLSDGQEVNQFGTSPQQQDSDGDTLLDGVEVNEHGTSPSNPDTDGDGTPDGVEVSSGTDPLQPPTATAPPTVVTPPTATSTATSTPSPTATSTPSPTPTPTATSDGDGGVIIVPPVFFFDYFTHQANNENRSGQSTFIDNGLANEKPDARLIVTQFWNPDGSSGVYNDHAIGVWYNNTTNRWAIFNQDIEPMPNNAAFNVLAPAESVSFVHTATAGNITGNYTTFSHPQANNNPNAVMLITQNWNPGGGSGTYNDHNVGVWYNNSTNRWAIFNQDQNSMPANASFNVRVFDDDDPAFVHTATAGNITAGYTVIDHPSLNDNPDATVFVTQNWNPGGGGGTYNDHAIGVWYIQSSGRWSIFNQDTAGMPPGASFNVYVR